MRRAVVVNYSSLLPHRQDIHRNLPSQYTQFIFLFMRPSPLLGAFHTSIGREFRITSWLPQSRPKKRIPVSEIQRLPDMDRIECGS